jgi:uncharacterized protein YbaP (TraB family)
MANCRSNHRIWNRILGIVLILGFVLAGWAGASGQQDQAEGTSKSCLWSVQNATHAIYLLGSIHVLKSDAYPLKDTIEDAYLSSQKVVFETDLNAMMDPAVVQKMMQLAYYPEGQTLNQHLRTDTLNQLEAKMKELGLPMQQFGRYKPWFIALTLAQLELQRLGYHPVHGVDMHYFGRAKRDGKETGFLEPVDVQINLLGKLDAFNQDELVVQTLEEVVIVAEMAADMLAYWQAGDTENLYRLLNKSFEKHPELRDKLLIQRNRMWVSGIADLMNENKNVLVIVGAGHLVGPDSLIDLLQKKGYRVKQH